MKKLQIFPFECVFSGQNYDFKGQVLNISQKGFVCNTGTQIIRTSASLKAKFTLPMTTKTQEVEVVAFKTYDKFSGSKERDHITEFLFKNPSEGFRSTMIQFMAHIQAYLI